MERLLSELVERLGKAHGESLVSVILYGSAAAEDGKDRLSDYNVLCVLKHVGPAELGRSEQIFRWWRDMGSPAPLLLSEDEVRASVDCFPMEFTDIRERRQVLAGSDVVRDLAIDYRYYRAQVEHELRAKLLRLRQKAGGLLSDNELLLRLMADSVSTFCVLLRHALMLAGEAPHYRRREIVERAAARFGLGAGPFLTLLDVREGRLKAKQVEVQGLFGEYLRQIDLVVKAVDQLNEGGGIAQ